MLSFDMHALDGTAVVLGRVVLGGLFLSAVIGLVLNAIDGVRWLRRKMRGSEG